MAIANGLYEIRSMLLNSMCVDVSGASAVKGANVLIYSNNDGNNQKFHLTEETSEHWSIQSASSGLYVDVARGAAQNGANVQQWTDNDARNQRWNVVDTGETVNIDGVSCPVVTIGSYVTEDGSTYMMDVERAMTSNSTNVLIWSANGGDNQKFALLPTTLLDRSMPVQSGIGWSGAIGRNDAQTVYPSASTLYPCWYFTDAWQGLQDHGFEISYRTRLIDNGTAQNGTWTVWTAWTAAPVTLYGQTAWLTAGLHASFDVSSYKAMEYNLRVRATGTVGGNTVHSSAITMLLRSVFAPTIAADSAKLEPGAISLEMLTDYEGGTNAVNITSIKAGGVEYLAKPLMSYGYGPSFTAEVTIGNLKAIPPFGTLDVSYEVGTDQYPATGVRTTSSVPFASAPSATIAVSPTLTFNDDGTATLTVTAGDVRSAWLVAGGETVTLEQTSQTTFVLPYPFGVSCDWFVSVSNSSGTAWGYASGTIAADDSRKVRACHAWNWDGGFFMLQVTDGFMQTSRTVKANASTYLLNNREWESMKFSDTLSGEFSAEGVLKDGLTESDKAALMLLARAHHVTYRAPSGEVAFVGITDVQYTTRRGLTFVSVSMQQVSR